jgi:gas vesicle protein
MLSRRFAARAAASSRSPLTSMQHQTSRRDISNLALFAGGTGLAALIVKRPILTMAFGTASAIAFATVFCFNVDDKNEVRAAEMAEAVLDGDIKRAQRKAEKIFDATAPAAIRLADEATQNFRETLDDIKSRGDNDKSGEFKSKAQEGKRYAEDKYEDAKDVAKEKSGELKSKAKEGKRYAEDKYEDAKDTVKEKSGELKSKAQEGKRYAEDKYEDAKDTVKEKSGELKSKAKDAKRFAENKYEDAKDTAKDAKDYAEDKYEDAKDAAQEKYAKARRVVVDKYDDAKDTAYDAKKYVEEKASQAKEKVVEWKDSFFDDDDDEVRSSDRAEANRWSREERRQSNRRAERDAPKADNWWGRMEDPTRFK